MSSTSTTPQKLKLAIIGLGLIGPRHAKSVLKNSNCTLIAIVDPSPQTVSFAKSLNTTHYTSISSLLSSHHKPDAVIICTPNNTHVPIATQFIKAGIHILLEKPISTSIPEGIELISSAKGSNIKFLIGHHRRFNPYLLSTKHIIDSGKLGEVIAIQGIWALKKPLEYFNGIGEWRKGNQTGGTVFINLVHEIDLLQYLLGPICSVSAFEMKKKRGFDAEEGCVIILRFSNGVVGTFLVGDNLPSPWNFEAGTGENPLIPKVRGEQGAGGFWRIMGTEGSLSVPDLKIWTGFWGDKLNVKKASVDEGIVPFDRQIEHFVRVVRGEAKVMCSGEEALSAMVVCEGVKRSMKTGRLVRIEGFEIVDEVGGKTKL